MLWKEMVEGRFKRNPDVKEDFVQRYFCLSSSVPGFCFHEACHACTRTQPYVWPMSTHTQQPWIRREQQKKQQASTCKRKWSFVVVLIRFPGTWELFRIITLITLQWMMIKLGHFLERLWDFQGNTKETNYRKKQIIGMDILSENKLSEGHTVKHLNFACIKISRS